MKDRNFVTQSNPTRRGSDLCEGDDDFEKHTMQHCKNTNDKYPLWFLHPCSRAVGRVNTGDIFGHP